MIQSWACLCSARKDFSMESMQGVFADDQLVPDTAKALVGITLVWLICLMLSYGFTLREAKEPNTPVNPVTVEARLDAADKLLSTPFFALVALMAIKGTLELRGDVNTRWHGTSPTSRWAMILYVARMIMDFPIQQVTLAKDRPKLVQMTAHHILSALAVGGGLVTGRMHYFALLDLCCETTTIFLNTIFALKTLSPPNSVKNSMVAFLGIGLFVSFLIFRIALFPYWLLTFHADVQASPKITWDAVQNSEKYFYVFVNVFLFILSCVWMVPITKGTLKALGPVFGKKPKVEAKTAKKSS